LQDFASIERRAAPNVMKVHGCPLLKGNVEYSIEIGHGRIEKRTCYLCTNIDWLAGFIMLKPWVMQCGALQASLLYVIINKIFK